jgi:hypothetical protein
MRRNHSGTLAQPSVSAPDPVDRYDLSLAQEQDGEQRPRLAGRKLEQSVFTGDLERPQDPELERLAHGRSTGVNRSSTVATEAFGRRENSARTGQA